MEQRSDDWYKARLGRFTASRISELLADKGVGKTGESYVFEKACEIVFGSSDDEDFVPFDIKRGIELEPFAFDKFKAIKALEFIEVQKTTFFPYGEHAGASPDGLVGNDACLEIKCPRPTKLFRLIKDGLKAIDKVYYDQMQMQMLCTNSNKCYFFNYVIFKGKELYHEIIVERDDNRIELIKNRIKEAIELRDSYVLEIKKNIQF